MEQMLNTTIREKAYLRCVGVIMDKIANGQLQYGDQLYKEQELAEMLGVSRPTMREALRVLEFLGVASAVPHKGISIRRPMETGGYLPLLYILSFEKTTNKELFELRQALQMEMAAQAAAACTPEDVRQLRALVRKMRDDRYCEPEVFSEMDDAFHQKLVEVSGNQLVYKLMETIRPMLRNQLTEHIQRLPVVERDNTIAAHTKIVDCLERHDGMAARLSMYEHLTESRRDAGNEPVKFSK